MTTTNETRPDDEPVTRETLYSPVWAEPMLKVAKRFGVSSSYLARVCTILNVPRPEPGYWAKLAVGKAAPLPILPEAQAGDELFWARSNQPIRAARPLPRPPKEVIRRPQTRKLVRPDEHTLIAGAALHFQAGRVSSEVGYLKPHKRLLVDVVTSQATLSKALAFANRLFLALEEDDHRVVLAPSGEHFHREAVEYREDPTGYAGYNEIWSPARQTVVYVGTVAIGLTVIEMSERVTARYIDGKYIRETDYSSPTKRGRRVADQTWTTQKSFPSGRLCLQAYSPYMGTKWARQWHQSKGADLSGVIPSIVRELRGAAGEIARLVKVAQKEAEKEHQRWEVMQQQWRQEEAHKRAAQALKDSKDELLSIIDAWGRSNRIENFFQEVELAIAALNEDDRSRFSSRLQLGRQLIGDLNPLERFSAWKSPQERQLDGNK
jgi:hypothetical protein